MSNSYVMPAEWEPHRATWIAWPHEKSDWPGKFEPIRWVYAEIVRVLAQSEHVEILCKDSKQKAEVLEALELYHVSKDHFTLHILPTDRSWLRDSAPTWVRDSNGKAAWVAWKFNAWAKYENYSADSKVPAYIGEKSQISLVNAIRSDNDAGFVMEGGAFDVDGEGTILVTEECLLSDTQIRNPNYCKQDYEQTFASYLGIKKSIWLKSGTFGDDTHGHIDDIARFVGDGRVCLAYEEDKNDENYEPSVENFEILSKSSDAKGRKLEIIKIPYPRAIFFNGQRLPASYLNFYIANKAILVPTFNDKHDATVISIYRELFPNREVIGIHSLDLILGLGTLHCLTQQEILK